MHTDSTVNSALKNIAELIDRQDFTTALWAIHELNKNTQVELSNYDSGRLSFFCADALYNSGDYTESMAQVNRAIEEFRYHDPDGYYGRAKDLRGLIHLVIGVIPNAVDDFREALFAFKRVDNRQGELTSYNRLARCAFANGKYKDAERHLSQAVELSEELGDTAVRVSLRANLGMVQILLGDYKNAKLHLMLDEKYIKSMPLVHRCNFHGQIVYLHILLREFKIAREHIDAFQTLAVDNAFKRQEGMYHEYAGELAYWQDDYAKAEKHYREAIRIGLEIAPEGDLISQSYRLLAELQIAQGKIDDAAESCDRAWVVAEKINERLELGAIQRARGEIAAKRQDADAARTAFADAIRILGEIDAKYELARAHLQAGEADVFDQEYRRYHLAIAAVLFNRVGVEYWQTRTAQAMERLSRPGDGTRSSRSTKISPVDSGKPLVAASPVMRDIVCHVDRIKDTDATVLLLGETGVGKDRLAEYIHAHSNRRDRPFQVISVANYPAELLAGELFGHTKGAFTNANASKPGLLEVADGGTVYLDEISEIPPQAQVLLLEFLERKEIQRLGGRKRVKLDVRFMAATNRDLQRAIRVGQFRVDLFYRLNHEEITIPPLRSRPSDIIALARDTLLQHGFAENDVSWLLDSPFASWLAEAPWPGNVRQLQSILGRIVSRTNGNGNEETLAIAREVLDQAGLLSSPERNQLVELLEANDWNRSQTARALGVSEGTIRRRMQEFGIRPPDIDQSRSSMNHRSSSTRHK